jgi:hypothetical protein
MMNWHCWLKRELISTIIIINAFDFLWKIWGKNHHQMALIVHFVATAASVVKNTTRRR